MISRMDLCPDDPLAPGLIGAYDAKCLAATICAAFPSWLVTRAYVKRAKYKPYSKALLSVVAECADGQNRVVALRLLPPEQVSAQYERAIRKSRAPQLVVSIPSLGAVAWAFPDDYRMPNLFRLFDREWLSDVVIPDLMEAIGPGASILAWTSELVQYAPEQSCTVRLTIEHARISGETRRSTFYGKHLAADEGADANAVLKAICDASPSAFDIAPIVLQYPEHGVQWQSSAAGDTVAATEFLARDGALLSRTARAVAQLHQIPVSTVANADLVDIDRLERRMAVADCMPRHARADIANTIAQLRAREPAASLTGRLCHGDLHPKNIFATQDRITLIDFDAARVGPAEYDVASFAAALIYHGARAGLIDADIWQVVDRWVSAYRSAGGSMGEDRLNWLMIYCLLDERLYRCLTRLKAGRRETAERLVGFASRFANTVFARSAAHA
jgi:Phosphotransferase enzyme family